MKKKHLSINFCIFAFFVKVDEQVSGQAEWPVPDKREADVFITLHIGTYEWVNSIINGYSLSFRLPYKKNSPNNSTITR